METTSARRDTAELDARVFEMTRPEFIARVVCPAAYAGSGRPEAPVDGKAVLVQNRGTGRVTVSYLLGGDMVLFGKLYSDGLGPHSVRVLKGLAEGGFGPGEPYRVPSPLLYLSEQNLLLASAAEGRPLMSFIEQGTPDLVAHVRQAARWLVRLHRLPLRIGQPDSLWESLKLPRLVRRLAKAAASAPLQRALLIGMIRALHRAGEKSRAQSPVVQTHGRFHYEHVFVDGATITVIDFDRSQPSDPAKDLAEFVTMLRLLTFKLTGSTDRAEVPTRAFLEEYCSHLPENAGNLAVHWGAFLLLNMLRYVKKHEAGDESFGRMMRFYRTEFDAVLSGERAPGVA